MDLVWIAEKDQVRLDCIGVMRSYWNTLQLLVNCISGKRKKSEVAVPRTSQCVWVTQSVVYILRSRRAECDCGSRTGFASVWSEPLGNATLSSSCGNSYQRQDDKTHSWQTFPDTGLNSRISSNRVGNTRHSGRQCQFSGAHSLTHKRTEDFLEVVRQYL